MFSLKYTFRFRRPWFLRLCSHLAAMNQAFQTQTISSHLDGHAKRRADIRRLFVQVPVFPTRWAPGVV